MMEDDRKKQQQNNFFLKSVGDQLGTLVGVRMAPKKEISTWLRPKKAFFRIDR